ncbi:HAMP domain-containing histidine kinase [Mycobacterium sp. MBM]|nr:HAMP domain-containing histidine kinase [Mycobacterium sp. MBM]
MRVWRSWTLLRQLVVGLSVMVMLAVATIGAMSVVTLRSSVLGIIDTQLDAALQGCVSSVVKYRSTPGPDGQLPGPGEMKPLVNLIGQAQGNVVALIQDGRVVDSAHFLADEAVPAPPEALSTITETAWTDGQIRTVQLPGLGWYRMVGQPGENGEMLVTGVSHTPAWQAMVRETAVVSGLTLLALVVTALSTLGIVRFALRPLRRVSATAAEVATLPLDRDNHTIAPRVPAGDTDPRTEVGQVGDTLNRLLDHVEGALSDVAASDRRMRQFITDASHELRTPLAAIHGYAELTRQDAAVLPEMTEYSLARIEAEARRMSSLVADLLLLARLDEGQDLAMGDVDLAELLTDAVNDVAVSAPEHRWTLDVPGHPVWVRGDRARLHQTMSNLLHNARVHTPAGSSVHAVITLGDNDIELTVTDDGPGIAAELLPHLFERFVRADKSRSREAGSFGLGLSIAASIVEAHSGSITARSVPGATTFVVRLPRLQTDPSVTVQPGADPLQIRHRPQPV